MDLPGSISGLMWNYEIKRNQFGWCLSVTGFPEIVEIDGVRGWLLLEDISFLKGLARDLPIKGSYLEVGSWLGLSAITFAKQLKSSGNNKASIYCVDTWEGSSEHQNVSEIRQGVLFEKFLDNVRRLECDDIIMPLKGKSVDIARIWNREKLDMVFVDGDHSYEGCLSDILSWLPHIKENGRMIGHDINWPGVKEAVLKVSKQKNYEVRITGLMWELIHR